MRIIAVLLSGLVLVIAEGAIGGGCAGSGQAPGEASAGGVGCASGTQQESGCAAGRCGTLLERIEQAGARIKSYQADMVLRQEQVLMDSLEIRRGELYYQVGKDEVRFRVHFGSLQEIDTSESEAEQQKIKPIKFEEDFSFDGQWLIRRDARTKTIEKWQVSKEKRGAEAFRLGSGPLLFPLPFALKKADVLREFEAELLPSGPNEPGKTDHLLLKPKKGGAFAGEYRILELWLCRKNTVPVQMRFETEDHEVTTILWSNIVTDKAIKAEQFQLAPAGEDWTVREKLLHDEK